MTTVRLLRVFTDDAGESGNALGVVSDAGAIPFARRQAIAAELGYSETVFIEDDARLQIFTPAVELPFAGHPLVGCAWLLRRPVLQCLAGSVRARVAGEQAWIRARAAWCPPFERRQLAGPLEVAAFSAPVAHSLQIWAWEDESRGRVRARCSHRISASRGSCHGVGRDRAVRGARSGDRDRAGTGLPDRGATVRRWSDRGRLGASPTTGEREL